MGVGQGVECVKRRKKSEIVAQAAAWSDWTVSNGVAVSGCCKVCTRFFMATTVVSAAKVVGMAKLWGKKSTVRVMCSLQVRDTKMRWQR